MLAGAAFLLAACALAWQPSGPRRVAPIPGATPVGAAECDDCHDPHGRAEIAAYHRDCETCHGPGSVHALSQEPDDIRHPANGDCLACHAAGRDTHLAWGTGEHSRAGLFCTDCHAPHVAARRHLRAPESVALAGGALMVPGSDPIDPASRLCMDCHEEVAARFTLPSSHPVRAGMLGCTSCHDPHEDSRVALLDRSGRCAGCHQDVVGPWVFEHEPVAEDCTECHDPHGAPAPDLLAVPQPVICLECHSLPDLWHHNTGASGIVGNTTIDSDFPPPDSGAAIKPLEARTFLADCTTCHGAIHGSYTDPTLQH